MASAELAALADQKRALRRVMGERGERVAADERVREAAAAGVSDLLGHLPEWQSASRRGAGIAAFAAVRGEIDPAAALTAARLAGARLAFPRVPRAGEADQAAVSGAPRPRLRLHLAGLEDLRPGRFGIPEPAVTSPELEPEEIAVMLVPGLAFDRLGNRLGFGGGYYDEWLTGGGPVPEGASAKARRPGLVVGVGYDFQLVEACPAGPHDARVDCVVTPARVIRCQHASSQGRSGSDGSGAGAGADDGKVDA